MQFIEFRNEVLAHLNRSSRDLTVSGTDLVASAANRAKNEAEKLIDFEALRCQVTLSVDLQDGALLSTAVLQGTATPVRVNRIERAFIIKDGVARPAEYVTRATMHRRLGATWNQQQPWSTWIRQQPVLPDTPIVFRSGQRIYVWPGGSAGLSEPVLVGFDVTKWSDPYTYGMTVDWAPISGPGSAFGYTQTGIANNQPLFGFVDQGTVILTLMRGAWYDIANQRWKAWNAEGEVVNGPITAGIEGIVGQYSGQDSGQTYQASLVTPVAGGQDFFLDDCVDWLLLATLKKLNNFIKDEKRTVVTNVQVQEAFTAMSAWNATQADLSQDEITLD